MLVVRGADDVKIAQRFIAGIQSGLRISPRSGRLKVDIRLRLKRIGVREKPSISAVRFTDSVVNPRRDPSTQSAGLFSSRPLRGRNLSVFLGKATVSERDYPQLGSKDNSLPESIVGNVFPAGPQVSPALSYFLLADKAPRFSAMSASRSSIPTAFRYNASASSEVLPTAVSPTRPSSPRALIM